MSAYPPSSGQGYQPPPPPGQNFNPYPAQPQNNPLALASLITGIASIPLTLLCFIGIILVPIAVVLGIIALVQIKQSPATSGGKGMAIAGIICGLVCPLLFVLLFALGIAGSILSSAGK